MTSWTVDRIDPDDAQRAAITRLAEAAEAADGLSPLDDQVRIDLKHPSDAAAHLIARDPAAGNLVAYAHVDLRSETSASIHVVVAPDRRRHGIGRSVLDRATTTAGARSPSAWAHGDLPGAAALAGRVGWTRVRELRQLLLPLGVIIDVPSYADGVDVRTFEPGRDEAAWVAVNGAAFADHPEQGRMTVGDLREREEEDWFDPAGLFLAERDGALLGSHWTKVHALPDGSNLGEVYVVGVSPEAQGLGLGKALTLTGLQHLRSAGHDVMLYVDADNTAAVALYERIGFSTLRIDVMYAERPLEPTETAVEATRSG